MLPNSNKLNFSQINTLKNFKYASVYFLTEKNYLKQEKCEQTSLGFDYLCLVTFPSCLISHSSWGCCDTTPRSPFRGLRTKVLIPPATMVCECGGYKSLYPSCSQVIESGYLGERAYFGQAVLFDQVKFLGGADWAVSSHQGTTWCLEEGTPWC